MKNTEAADVLREYIRTNKPCNGLEMALQKAITALEHVPDDEAMPEPIGQQCTDCGKTTDDCHKFICECGSIALRPLFVSKIGR